MDAFSRSDLDLLTQQAEQPCVSLYLPTHPVLTRNQEDPLRLKNLLARAEQDLVDSGTRTPLAREILRPGRELVEDESFWLYQDRGLAVFLREGWWARYRLPIEFDERRVVSNRFHVTPLLPMLTGHGHYFVLALSEKHARLLSCTRTGVSEVTVPNLPQGVAEALPYDEPQQVRGHHFGGRVGAKVRSILHRQGIGAEVEKERLERYVRAVHDAVRPVLRGRHDPLVLAGVDYIRSAYRNLADYPNVLQAGVPGNPDRVPDDELRAQAWDVVAPVLTRQQEEAAAGYRAALGTGLASNDPEEVAGAAEAGRVEVLFLSEEATADERLQPAAVHTLRTGGTVYAPADTGVPDGTGVAAVFRY